PSLAHEGADVHHAAELALDHRLERGARAVIDAVEVGADHLGPVLVGELPHRPVPRDAGVVDEDVEVTELLEDRGDEAARFALDAHVGAEQPRRASARADEIRHLASLLLAGTIVERDARAVLGQLQRDRATETARRPGHERGPAFQAWHENPLVNAWIARTLSRGIDQS